mmetsp:Transcript_20098/g.51169  ORF Transcript_20098/g.51169 Transcript_20098/m.51169 type:complete len:567 (-) Transcript_20098:302-2002(-)
MPGLLSEMLHHLEIPSDARLTSVSTSIDPVDGAMVWTVQYKAVPAPTTYAHPAAGGRERSGSQLRPDSPSPMYMGGVVSRQASVVQLPQVPRQASVSQLPVVSMPPQTAQGGHSFGLGIDIPSSMTYQTYFAPAALIERSTHLERCFQLKCIVQTYAWGKIGLDSAVARIAFAEGSLNDDIELEESSPYAELWMGTHPSGPSMVVLDQPWKTITPLSEWLKHNPEIGGSKVRKAHKGSVPFLLKVLSVRTALSIQAHPDKLLAQELHAKRADLYKDDNHKPEMAIAITPFEALCSFQRATSIVANCANCPELVELIGEECVYALDQAATSEENVQPALKQLYTNLMLCPQHVVAQKLQNLISRIEVTVKMLRAPVDTLAMRVHEQYPGDVGVFCVYLLNYMCLKPGEALFMAANEPHAYIFGDCVECMACSDNVVRAGLTPKFKDTSTLCEMLTYKDGPVERIQGSPVGKFVTAYIPPPDVDEFRMERCQLPPKSAAPLKAVDGVSILLVIAGSGTVEEAGTSATTLGAVQAIGVGSVYLVSANTHLTLKTFEDGMLAFRAMPRNA